MEDIDNKVQTEIAAEEDRLFMSQVICEEADLFYMDCYLRELFKPQTDWTQGEVAFHGQPSFFYIFGRYDKGRIIESRWFTHKYGFNGQNKVCYEVDL